MGDKARGAGGVVRIWGDASSKIKSAQAWSVLLLVPCYMPVTALFRPY